MQNIVFLVVAFVVGVTLTVAFLKFRHRQQELQKRQSVLRKMLEDAQMQNNVFEVNLHNKDIHYHTISCFLGRIGKNTLELEALSLLPPDLCNQGVEVFYRIISKEGVAIHKFHSVIKELRSQSRRSTLIVDFPAEIGSGERRLFHRIEPPKDRVRVIALWPLADDQPLPRETGDFGSPLLQYRYGSDQETILVSDVSASGMAVQIFLNALAQTQHEFKKNSQVAVLLVYFHAADRPLIVYWSSCKICNIRALEGPNPSLILGMEFTNWALMERGKTEIQWLATKESAGVSPMSQWVMQMDRDQMHLK